MLGSDSKKESEYAKRGLEALDTITCFYCMDWGMVQKTRTSSFAWMDGRGSYDVVWCEVCNKGSWK